MRPNRPTGRTYIVVTRWTGHRLHYVRLLASASLDRGRPVTVLLPDAATASPEYQVHLGDLDPLDRELLADSNVAHAVRRASELAGTEDLVVFPDGDAALAPLALHSLTRRLRTRTSVLLMRTPTRGVPWQLRSLAVAMAKALLVRVARPPISIRQLTDSLRFGQPHPLFGSVSPVPDPVATTHWPTRAEARRTLGLDPDAFIVLAPGVMRANKHPTLILDAWQRSPLHHRRGVRPLLVLAGNQHPRQRAGIEDRARHDPTIETHDRYLPTPELEAYIAAADGVVLVSASESPSGTLATAIAAQRPILVSASNRSKALVDHHGIGVTCDANQEALARGFDQLHQLAPIEQWPRSAPVEAFTTPLLEPDE
ncbi:MAG: glycosyltransferase [Acidimicrobiales bacterium]|nr:glycosyltransferase [Acidimicrobiales bacterium]